MVYPPFPFFVRSFLSHSASSPNVKNLQERLARTLKTRVRLVASDKNRGRIEINYASLDELDRLLEILLK